jgi:hypothetical protein
MKKLLLVFLILVPFFFMGQTFSYGAANYETKSIVKTATPTDWVEYVCISGQWFKITYDSQGRPIDIKQIAKPPVE